MFARRTSWDLSPNALSERVASRRAAGLPVLDLTESNPTRCALAAPAALLREALRGLAGDPRAELYEPDPRGLPGAREAIAAFHAARSGWTGSTLRVAADAIVLTAGTSEAYAHLFRLLGDPGDLVLVPRPSYPLFEFLAELEGLETAPYSLVCRDEGPRRGWSLDLDSLRGAMTPRTRAVVVVSPHNPAGHVISADEASALRALCAEHGVAIIADEVFADFVHAGAGRSLLAGPRDEAGPLTFVLSGVSKALALPQLKLGWIAVDGPPALRDEALARLELIADTYLSVNGLGQLLLPGLLAGADAVQRELRERLARNRAVLERAVAPHGALRVLPSEGGWAAIVRVEPARGRAPLDEEALVLRLLDADGVLVHPGFFFDLTADACGVPGSPGAAQLVLSLLPPPASFERAAQALARACEAAAVDGEVAETHTLLRETPGGLDTPERGGEPVA